MGQEQMRVKLNARSASDEDLVDDMRRVAAMQGTNRLTRETYDEHGQFHSSTVHRRFGGWRSACEAAGLSGGRPDLGHADDVWMANILRIWLLHGRQPTYADMRDPESQFSPEGYGKRFGSWHAALTRFQKWLDQADDPEAAQPTRAGVPAKRGPRSPNLRLRFRVLQRDNFACTACGASPAISPGTVLHVDHVVPYSKGGETRPGNLTTLCVPCNLGKADSVPDS